MVFKDIPAHLLLRKVKEEQPLVHHITNWVTIYDCATVVKAFGASPVMAHAPEEAADMAGIASAVVLNIGTLTVELVEAMKLAAAAANKKGIPVILDVCGAGATRLRDEKCFELLKSVKIDVLKGNASEIARIGGEQVRTKGVDTAEVEKNLVEVARHTAELYNCTVVITGPEDIVVNAGSGYLVKNGHPLLGTVVGTGCLAGSVIGIFCAVEKDYAVAAAAGLSCFEIAAEIAVKGSNGPGTFKEQLIDCVYNLDEKTVKTKQKVEQIKKA
ncbi:MAG TPA: hydroxyethylthiazole kinase [Candidatus Omnitrophota bacterium]|nr:hydroxyethylthiazole kinase [Candidatus Omnitrophota bacterium]HRZ15524.1 hydroxyethylthiazole kinase [Candidatus Omnitrophota bacterium]